MSSTFVHYSTPSSLPSDYALLSRFASSRRNNDNNDSAIENTEDESDEAEQVPEGRLSPRRSSFPAEYIRPLNPTMAPMPSMSANKHKTWSSGSKSVIPSENTPLLGPLVPRIEEEVDGEDNEERAQAARNIKIRAYWEETKILAKYTLPVFGSHLLEYSLVIASVVSLGHLSTVALASSTLGSMTASVTGFSIIQGFSSTLDTMLPSAWTSSHPNLVGLWSQRMAVVMFTALIPIIAIWFNSEAILLGLRQDPEVAHLASVYLKWLSLGLPAYTFNTISRRYFQSQGLFTVPTQVILAIAPVNAFLNYLLVWGPAPIRLGYIGAPIATAISYNLISLFSLLYGIFFVEKTAWHPLSFRCFTSLGVLVQLGLAGVGQTASEWWSWELIGLAASLLGPISLASQSVLLVSASSTYQAPFALSVATSVRIGNLLGERNANRARISAEVSLLIALVLAGISSTMFLVFRNSWAYIFNDDPAVVSLVASILPLVALFQVFDGLSACTAGILRARGKQFTGALLNLSAYYIIGIPFGIWLAFKRDMNLAGLWVGLTVSLVYSATFGVALCLKTDWQHEVDKVMARLAKDKRVLSHGEP
ncbi:MATE efflux family protein [Rickenella mellea]|uniref:MATE efflux family protein n=1 Tax=Rickenella mellea TaxID=50990 RepID=A0A4Y7PX96_9AGAM|nr:MATE efflux family protein [Rickenella mellea]TDL19638.1 MATE efflux family protein [Rickenella mellea]